MIDPRLVSELRNILGETYVEVDEADLIVYESDGLTLSTARPGCVVYPGTTDDCVRIVRACDKAGVSFVARGAGTGLSGGALCDGGVLLQMSRMNRVLKMQPEDRYAVVQPGVVNNYLTLQSRPYGLQFAPDPSSQVACTIGGNVAENAGGPHTLKYGVTANHILGQTVVLPNGEVVSLGGPFPVSGGPDISAFLVGSEGTLAVTTEVTVRLTPVASSVTTMLATYNTMEGATDSVSAILAAGVLPAALELIDHLCIVAVESHMKIGLPQDAAAVLLIELDGDLHYVSENAVSVAAICKSFGAVAFETARTEADRQRLWRGRKHAVGTLGKITPAFYINDGVVPRSRITEIFQEIYRLGGQYHLRIANLCHAGDGNIHPNLLYNPENADEIKRTLECSADILQACLEMGGSLTGEHGIGLEKRHLIDKMFTKTDLNHMSRLRQAFNPKGLLNPGKIFPRGSRCGEIRDAPVPGGFPAGTWI